MEDFSGIELLERAFRVAGGTGRSPRGSSFWTKEPKPKPRGSSTPGTPVMNHQGASPPPRPGRKEWSFQRSYARQTRQQTCEQTCEQRLKQKVRQIDIHCVNLFVHWTALMFNCQSDADCVCIEGASARSNAAPLANLAGAARARGNSSPFRARRRSAGCVAPALSVQAFP